MDSGRLALLEKAREFGSLAQKWSIDEFLERTVTYRTLALYLGIQSEWWEEFWRSFSFAATTIKNARWCCRARDLPFLMSFLSNWFGKGGRIANISGLELLRAYRLVMREGNDEGNDTRFSS